MRIVSVLIPSDRVLVVAGSSQMDLVLHIVQLISDHLRKKVLELHRHRNFRTVEAVKTITAMIRGRKYRLIFLCILQFLKCGAVLLLVLELCADVRPPAILFLTTGRPREFTE
jgi:hypothetical protein